MSHERISPTAWLVAYQRTLTNIPLSQEIFQELDKLLHETKSAEDVARVEGLKSSQLAVMWESRFKIVDHILKASQVKQVLEIAAGFSPRGLDTARDPSVTYVEVDLPGLVQEKQQIIEMLVAQAKIPALPNFHLVEGNALNLQDLRAATRDFANSPIAVVNEGLLPYLNRDERTTLANNVHALLEQFGGMWITPDIDIQLPQGAAEQVSEVVKARMAQIEKLTGVDVNKNRFQNEADAHTFFEQCGFQVERHSFMEVADQIVLPPEGSLARKAIERGVLFVMTIQKG